MKSLSSYILLTEISPAKSSALTAATPSQATAASTSATGQVEYFALKIAIGISPNNLICPAPQPGIDSHPLAVKHHLKRARDRSTDKHIDSQSTDKPGALEDIRLWYGGQITGYLPPVFKLDHQQLTGGIHNRRNPSIPYRNCNLHNNLLYYALNVPESRLDLK
jgi:hypothetical protein